MQGARGQVHRAHGCPVAEAVTYTSPRFIHPCVPRHPAVLHQPVLPVSTILPPDLAPNTYPHASRVYCVPLPGLLCPPPPPSITRPGESALRTVNDPVDLLCFSRQLEGLQEHPQPSIKRQPVKVKGVGELLKHLATDGQGSHTGSNTKTPDKGFKHMGQMQGSNAAAGASCIARPPNLVLITLRQQKAVRREHTRSWTLPRGGGVLPV